MKKLTIIKQSLYAAVAIAGMNIFSSCDSCSRKEPAPDETTTDMETEADTSAYNDSAYDDSSATGVNDGSGTSRSIKAGYGKGNAATKPFTASGTATSSNSGSTKTGPTEEEIANRIENSDYKSGTVDKNGKPVQSSGAAGSGQGTGTGSTGNNSRVSTKEAQRSN